MLHKLTHQNNDFRQLIKIQMLHLTIPFALQSVRELFLEKENACKVPPNNSLLHRHWLELYLQNNHSASLAGLTDEKIFAFHLHGE